jgi:outer membrane protein TolC
MKFKSCAFWLLAVVSLTVSISSAAAGSLGDLFSAATQSNQDYSIFKIDLEIAQLKKTKGEIEAKVELDRVNAQLNFGTALATYRNSVLSFYNEVIDVVFAAAIAELDVESVGLSLENAAEDRKYADSRFKNGLISEEVFKEIDILYKTTSTNYELASWTLKDAKDNFLLVTGLEWKSSLIPEVPAFESKATVEDWIAKNTSLERALLNEKIAALRMASLATNASVYDRRIQETENLKAKVSVASAESDAKRAYESARSTLKNQASLLQIRKDEFALKESAYKDALKQFERGMISLNDRNLRAISVITARKNLLAFQRNYIKSIGSFLSALGENPLGI